MRKDCFVPSFLPDGRRPFYTAALFFAVLALLAGCRRPASSSTPPAPLPLPPLAAPAPSARILLPDSIPLDNSVCAEWAGPVEVVSYRTNDEARSKIGQADLALVSQEIVAEMAASGGLLPLEDSLLSAPHRPQALFLHHYFDTQNRFSIPYAWSLLGAAFRREALPPAVKSWAAVFSSGKPIASLLEDPLFSRLTGKIGLQSVPQTVAPELADIQIGSIAALRHLPPEWTLVLPKEGSYITLYSWVIPTEAPHPEQARVALVALFKPENLARFGTETHWGITQKNARALLPAERAKHPLLYPSDLGGYLDLCEFLRP
jgi:spermidine/putrescine-binding protein